MGIRTLKDDLEINCCIFFVVGWSVGLTEPYLFAFSVFLNTIFLNFFVKNLLNVKRFPEFKFILKKIFVFMKRCFELTFIISYNL